MNSKECLNKILDLLNYEQVDECDKKGLLRIIKQDLDKLEQLEKENQELKETLNKTRKMGLETIEEKEQLSNELHKLNCYRNIELNEISKLKRALNILKEKLDIKLEIYHNGGCTLNHKIISNCITPDERCLRYLEVEEYELLKEVLE